MFQVRLCTTSKDAILSHIKDQFVGLGFTWMS